MVFDPMCCRGKLRLTEATEGQRLAIGDKGASVQIYDYGKLWVQAIRQAGCLLSHSCSRRPADAACPPHSFTTAPDGVPSPWWSYRATLPRQRKAFREHLQNVVEETSHLRWFFHAHTRHITSPRGGSIQGP